MYEAFYHLSAEPFRIGPDRRYCYWHGAYRRARTCVRNAVNAPGGLALITGGPGTGKTTLMEDLLAGGAGPGLVTARLVSSQLQAADMLLSVAYGFGLDPGAADKEAVLRAIESFLGNRPAPDRGALLVVDEAQAAPAEALQALRLLAGPEPSRGNRLRILLVGQDSLDAALHDPKMSPLRAPVPGACRLEALRQEEVRAYVEHRLRRAGWRGDPRIAGQAFALIHHFSHGVPRLINRLCARLLVQGALEERHELGPEEVAVAAHQLTEELLSPANSPLYAPEPAPGRQSGSG